MKIIIIILVIIAAAVAKTFAADVPVALESGLGNLRSSVGLENRTVVGDNAGNIGGFGFNGSGYTNGNGNNIVGDAKAGKIRILGGSTLQLTKDGVNGQTGGAYTVGGVQENVNSTINVTKDGVDVGVKSGSYLA